MQDKEKNYFFSLLNTIPTPILCTLQLPKTHFYVIQKAELTLGFRKSETRAFSLSLAVHVSPEGRRAEVAGALLAWRDKIKNNEKGENICEIRAICVTSMVYSCH